MSEYVPAKVYKVKEDCAVYKSIDSDETITRARKGNVFVSSGILEGDYLYCETFKGYIRLQYLEVI